MEPEKNPDDPDVTFAPRSRGTAETAFDLGLRAATIRLRSDLGEEIKDDQHINLIDAETDETFGTGDVEEVYRAHIADAWEFVERFSDTVHGCHSEAHLIATLNHHYEPTIWPSSKVDVIVYEPILYDR